jgi:hypothetical protein
MRDALDAWLEFAVVSGPGEVDPETGKWTWNTSPADSGKHTVVLEAYNPQCGPGTCQSRSFVVDLRPLVSGDVNCDGVVDVLDVVAEVNHAFRAEPAPIPCWDR